MRTIVAFLAAFLIGTAAAAPRTLEFTDALVTLGDGPCEVKDLQAPGAKGGTVKPLAGGPAHKLCYIEGNGMVFIADEQGNTGIFPSEMFVPAKPKGQTL
jgi:hypothetical protein